MLKPPVWQRHCDDERVHRYNVRIIDQCDVTIASGPHIDDVTTAKLLTFAIISGAARNERHDFRLSKKIQLQTNSGILQWRISPEVEFTSVMTDFQSSAIERICEALNSLVSDVIINWHAQLARRKMSLIPSALPNVLLLMACRCIVGIVNILKMILWNLRK